MFKEESILYIAQSESSTPDKYVNQPSTKELYIQKYSKHELFSTYIVLPVLYNNLLLWHRI